MLDASGFSNATSNSFGTGAFAIEQIGDNLAITFNGAVPEPSSLVLALLSLLLGLGLAGRRRRRRVGLKQQPGSLAAKKLALKGGR